MFRITALTKKPAKIPREILVWDPLGLVSPFVIRGRIFLQELWPLKQDWDYIHGKPKSQGLSWRNVWTNPNGKENFHVDLGTKSINLMYFTGKKGGALLSALHSNMQHGDPFVKSLVRHTLNLVGVVADFNLFVAVVSLEDGWYMYICSLLLTLFVDVKINITKVRCSGLMVDRVVRLGALESLCCVL